MCQPSTVGGYASIARTQLLPTFGPMQLETITPETIDAWLARSGGHPVAAVWVGRHERECFRGDAFADPGASAFATVESSDPGRAGRALCRQTVLSRRVSQRY
jgi:hypothetical protein